MANLISEFGTEQGRRTTNVLGRAVRKAGGIFEPFAVFVFAKGQDADTDFAGENDTVDPVGQSQELYRG